MLEQTKWPYRQNCWASRWAICSEPKVRVQVRGKIVFVVGKPCNSVLSGIARYWLPPLRPCLKALWSWQFVRDYSGFKEAYYTWTSQYCLCLTLFSTGSWKLGCFERNKCNFAVDTQHLGVVVDRLLWHLVIETNNILVQLCSHLKVIFLTFCETSEKGETTQSTF